MIPPITVAILFVGSILLFPEFYKQLHYKFVVLSVIAKLAIIYLILWVVGFIRYNNEKEEYPSDFNNDKIKSIIFYLFIMPLSSFEVISVALLILGLGYVVISYVDFIRIIILDLYNWVF
tara:strand:+ start:160 stop:519 length:360 start_codon:yes stop_codon:yes gene_type:complete